MVWLTVLVLAVGGPPGTKPFALRNTLVAASRNGRIVARSENGRLRVRVRRGRYTLRAYVRSGVPRNYPAPCRQTSVTLRRSRSVTLRCPIP